MDRLISTGVTGIDTGTSKDRGNRAGLSLAGDGPFTSGLEYDGIFNSHRGGIMNDGDDSNKAAQTVDHANQQPGGNDAYSDDRYPYDNACSSGDGSIGYGFEAPIAAGGSSSSPPFPSLLKPRREAQGALWQLQIAFETEKSCSLAAQHIENNR
jgi:hypothetical protein